MKRYLTILPPWLFSILTLMAIIWLTLAPKPLGDEPIPLFPGADKIAHGIMFGGFAVVMMLDWQRRHGWRMISIWMATACAALSSVVGMLTEIEQSNMGLGREFETGDIIADTIGSFIFSGTYLILQKYWCR